MNGTALGFGSCSTFFFKVVWVGPLCPTQTIRTGAGAAAITAAKGGSGGVEGLELVKEPNLDWSNRCLGLVYVCEGRRRGRSTRLRWGGAVCYGNACCCWILCWRFASFWFDSGECVRGSWAPGVLCVLQSFLQGFKDRPYG